MYAHAIVKSDKHRTHQNLDKQENELHNVLINAKAIKAEQYAHVLEIIEMYDTLAASDVELDEETRARYKARLYTRQECRNVNITLHNKRACAFYISKNVAAKRANHLYDLKVFKVMKSQQQETKAVVVAEKKKDVVATASKKRASKKVVVVDTTEAIALLEAATSESSEVNS